MILAIDPGRDKCGVALLDQRGEIREKSVIGRAHLTAEVLRILLKDKIEMIVIGQSACGRVVEKELRQFEFEPRIIFASEKNSSQLARRRYWREHPPRGLWRLIPTSFRFPPVPIDDYAAVVIGERYLKFLA